MMGRSGWHGSGKAALRPLLRGSLGILLLHGASAIGASACGGSWFSAERPLAEIIIVANPMNTPKPQQEKDGKRALLAYVDGIVKRCRNRPISFEEEEFALRLLVEHGYATKADIFTIGAVRRIRNDLMAELGVTESPVPERGKPEGRDWDAAMQELLETESLLHKGIRVGLSQAEERELRSQLSEGWLRQYWDGKSELGREEMIGIANYLRLDILHLSKRKG